MIRLDLNPGNYLDRVGVLYSGISTDLKRIAKKNGIALEGVDIINQFKNLIYSVHEKTGEKAVVIIDEYDKPELYEGFLNALKGFYGVLKSCDEYLRFVFLTA